VILYTDLSDPDWRQQATGARASRHATRRKRNPPRSIYGNPCRATRSGTRPAFLRLHERDAGQGRRV
jgi:hypothetical protein